MTGHLARCCATTLSTTSKSIDSSSSSSSSNIASSLTPNTSSILLLPTLMWSEMEHNDKKIMLVPDPLAAAAAAAAAAVSSSTTTSLTTGSSQSERIMSSEGYSSASSHENLSLARALTQPPLSVPSTDPTAFASASSAANNNNTVAEFLYQLSKMLTDDNRDIIEWSSGKIEVHSPQKLESQVLHKYFRHSKFASFQRQLNYFGFRKLAGKGKMAPCSYVNDETTQDLRSLLLIKRKASLTQSGKEKTKRKRDRRDSFSSNPGATATNVVTGTMVNPILAEILQRSTNVSGHLSAAVASPVPSAASNVPAPTSTNQIKGSLHDPLAAAGCHLLVTPQALAQAAVGRGIKHGLRLQRAPVPAPPLPPVPAPPLPPVPAPPLPPVNAPPLPPSTPSSVTTAPPAVPQPTPPTVPQKPTSTGELLFLPDAQISASIQESLSQLTNNFRNSLNDLKEEEDVPSDDGPRSILPGGGVRAGDGLFSGMLSRNSSLVDLAMLPDVQNNDDAMSGTSENDGFLMSFVDFPHQDFILSQQQQQEYQESQQEQLEFQEFQQQQQSDDESARHGERAPS